VHVIHDPPSRFQSWKYENYWHFGLNTVQMWRVTRGKHGDGHESGWRQHNRHIE
jgi:hypothetical protein